MNWKLLFVIAVVLVAFTRIPVTPPRLSVEGVNLAFALDELYPDHPEPRAPGFPFFVAAARFFASFVPRAEWPRTEWPRAEWPFLLTSVVVSAACLVVAFKLTSEMYSVWEAGAASMLLLVNPIFWFASLQSPLRPLLCLFILLAGWFSWRAWEGDDRSAMYGAITLGVSFGILPEVVLYMFPLWLVSAWKGRHSKRAVARGLAVILVGIVLALDILWVAVGSLEALSNVLTQYPFGTEIPSLDLSIAQPRLWMRSLGRFVFWNLIAVCAWAWVVFWRRDTSAFPMPKHAWFFLLWYLPAAIIHIAGGLSGPGQMLVYMPAVCLIGGHILSGAGQSAPVQSGVQARELSLMVALVISVLVFGEFVTVPAANAPQTATGVRRVLTIATYSIWETSLGPVRWSNEIVETSLWEVGDLVRTDRPIVLVAMDRTEEDSQTVGWRVASYYDRNHDIWVLTDSSTNPEARKIRGWTVVEIRKESPVVIPLPRGARIVWLGDPNGNFMTEARTKVPVNLKRKYVTFTDLAEDAAGFTIGAFLFTPS